MSLLNWRNTNVAIANRPIEAGEQLFDTYGALYYHMKTDDRRAYVKVSSMDWNIVLSRSIHLAQTNSRSPKTCPKSAETFFNGSPFQRSQLREGGSNDEVVEGLEGFPRTKKSRRGPFV